MKRVTFVFIALITITTLLAITAQKEDTTNTKIAKTNISKQNLNAIYK